MPSVTLTSDERRIYEYSFRMITNHIHDRAEKRNIADLADRIMHARPKEIILASSRHRKLLRQVRNLHTAL